MDNTNEQSIECLFCGGKRGGCLPFQLTTLQSKSVAEEYTVFNLSFISILMYC